MIVCDGPEAIKPVKLVGVGRIVSGEVIFLASPEWEQSAEEGGRLLRRYGHPMSRCLNDEQRAGWEAEDARMRGVPR